VSRRSSSPAALALAAIAAGWGVIGLIVRQLELPAVAVVAARCWLGATTIGLGLAVHARRTGARPPATRRPWLIAGCGVVLAVHWSCLVAAQQRAPIGTVMLVMYLAPVLVGLLAPRVLGENVAPTTKVALGLAALGLALVARPEPGAVDGLVFALAAGVTFAVFTLVCKVAVADAGGYWLGFSNLGIAGLVLAPWALAADWGAPEVSWWWLVVLGVLLTGVLTPLYLVMLGRLPASSGAVLLYLEPVSAVVLAWLVLGEDPGPLTLVGGVLIVAGGVIVARSSETAAETEVMSHVPG
jgi:drug/metabolite transporter, DME family